MDTFGTKISAFEDRRVAVGTLEPSRKVVFKRRSLAPGEFRVHNGQVVKAGDTLAIQPQPGAVAGARKATLELAERRAAYLGAAGVRIFDGRFFVHSSGRSQSGSDE
ncbi:MAG: hypothetical protein R3C61_03825 [Bacteroidia bacterium]